MAAACAESRKKEFSRAGSSSPLAVPAQTSRHSALRPAPLSVLRDLLPGSANAESRAGCPRFPECPSSFVQRAVPRPVRRESVPAFRLVSLRSRLHAAVESARQQLASVRLLQIAPAFSDLRPTSRIAVVLP